MNLEHAMSKRCNGVIIGVGILEHIEFTQIQDAEAKRVAFVEKQFHLSSMEI